MGALDDVVVLEMSADVAGGYAGKLLADLGAQVIKWEQGGGDPVRRMGPFAGGQEDPQRSGLFLYLHANKLGISTEDSERLRSVAANADIIIDTLPPGRLAGMGLGYQDLAAANPALVLTSVTPFGQYGPNRDMLTSELVEYAMGGYMYFGGDPAREPLALPCHQVEFHAGTHAAIASLAGLWYARETGKGQYVDISRQEAMLSAHAWLTTMWTHEGQIQKRTGSVLVKCADGYVYLMTLVPYQNLFVLIDRPEVLADEELFNPLVWWERFLPEVLPMFAEWAKDKPKMEVYRAAQELRVAISPVMNAADLLSSEQLQERAYFVDIEDPVAGTVTVPGFPYKLSDTPPEIRSSAPAAGQHNDEVLGGGFSYANSGRRRQPASIRGGAPNGDGRSLALEGLKVIEVTANWAGPIAGRHLADLGAEVIKVELPRRPATRALHYQGGEMWTYHWHRAAYFNKLNRNKRDVALDLSKPKGREVFLKLVEWADVLIENNSARVMGNLGVAYPQLKDVNPALIFVSMSGMGATGPEKDYVAYGSNVETLSGLCSLLGYGPGEYYGTGSFYADPVTGNHGTVAILAALNERRKTGKGQYVDMALQEAAIPYFAEAVLEYTLNGNVREPMGNRHPVFAPQGAYKCIGSDYWVALTCSTDEQWRALAAVLGREDLAGLSREERRGRHDELDSAISAWSAQYDHNEATRILQAAGIPAGPVLANWEIVADLHLHERQFFVDIPHPEAGVEKFPGMPWKFSETPGRVWRHAPLFAQDNDYFFKQMLGLSEGEVERLVAEDVTSYEPQFAPGSIL